MTNNPAKEHHYLSEFYLAGFTDNGTKKGKLFFLDLRSLHCFPKTPGQVAFREHFFSVEKDGLEPDVIEKDFRDLETLIAPVLKKVIDNEVIHPDSDLLELLVLVALNFGRAPRLRNKVTEIITEYGEKLLKASLVSREAFEAVREEFRREDQLLDYKIDYNELKQAAESGNLGFNIRNNYLVASHIYSIQIIYLLMMMQWHLVIAGEETGGFICSDAPVSCVLRPEYSGEFPADFISGATLLMMPISTKLTLIGEFFGQGGIPKTANKILVATINSATMRLAQGRIYFSNKDFVWLKPDGNFGKFNDIVDVLKQNDLEKIKWNW